MSALQCDRQQRAVDHGGLINQNQAEMFQGGPRLFGGFANLAIPLATQLESQQSVDCGGIPRGVKTL